MVVLGKHRVLGVMALEHPRRVRHPHRERALRARGVAPPRSWPYPGAARACSRSSGSHRHRARVRTARRLRTAIRSPVRTPRPRRVPSPRAASSAQRLPQRRIAHVLHLRVVDLEHVDVVGLQTLKTATERDRKSTPGPCASAARTARAAPAGPPHRTCRSRPWSRRPPAPRRPRNASANCRSRPAVAIGVRRIEERHAILVVRATQHRHGLGVRLVAPPVRGQCPRAEADLADGQVVPGKRPDSASHPPPSRTPSLPRWRNT